MTTCPGCGCAEDETPSDDCWTCQTDGESRVGERLSLYGDAALDETMRAQASAQSE